MPVALTVEEKEEFARRAYYLVKRESVGLPITLVQIEDVTLKLHRLGDGESLEVFIDSTPTMISWHPAKYQWSWLTYTHTQRALGLFRRAMVLEDLSTI